MTRNIRRVKPVHVNFSVMCQFAEENVRTEYARIDIEHTLKWDLGFGGGNLWQERHEGLDKIKESN